MKLKKHFLTTLLMVVVMMAMSPTKVWATNVTYLYPVYKTSGSPSSGIDKWEKGTTNATQITSSSSTKTLSAGWYYVSGTVSLSGGATCSGAVHLILCDGATLTVSNGITVKESNSLSIYAQSGGSGKLTVTGKEDCAAIGGDGWFESGGNTTINGGTVTVTGGESAAGIGGGYYGNGSNITINGGHVIAASGGGSVNALGKGGDGSSSSNIYINKACCKITGYHALNTTPKEITNTGGDMSSALGSLDHVEITYSHNLSTSVINPTCLSAGSRTTTCSNKCGYKMFEETSSALGHDYGTTASWKWGTNYKSATCTRTCTRTSCTSSTTGHTASATVTLGNGITSAQDTPATCTVMGKTKYTATATVGGKQCTDSKTVTDIPALGHTYGGPSWTWSDDGKTATCSRTCTNTNCTSSTTGHTASATVTLSGGGITSSVYKQADCNHDGTTAYTAKATVGGKEYTDTKYVDDIAAIGTHDYDNGFCTVCDKYEPLGAAVNGWYEIKNAGQLYSFAALVNSEAKDANGNYYYKAKARLTKDIVVNKGTFDGDGNFTAEGATSTSTPRSWTPIGNSSCTFQGQFDGNGYTISGLYYNDLMLNIGFIGFANGATIQKLGIVNGYFKGIRIVGAIIGQCVNATTIKKCWSDSKVIGTKDYVGGICGLNSSGSTIEDCYSSGTVNGENAGGICGYSYNYTTVNGEEKYSSISNCYSTATVSGTNSGSICGLNARNCSVTNCYASSGNLINSYLGNKPVNCETDVTDERFASGEICYKLNGSRSVGTDESPLVWYQKLGSCGDSYPVLTVAEGNTVYAGYDQCLYSYTNTAGLLAAEQSEHNCYDNGICSKCGDYLAATQITAANRGQFGFTDATYDNYYAIGNAGQLAWFRDFVKTRANASANAVLTADIDMSHVCHAANTTTGVAKLSWEPIGYSTSYLGIFDGNNKEVTNLYIDTDADNVGFIGKIGKYDEQTNAAVKNLTVRGSVKSSKLHIGGIVGYCLGTISGCTNYAIVEGTGDSYYIGGIAGYCNPGKCTAKIENCDNYGEITDNSQASSVSIAGIVGSSKNTEITNCSNHVKVETTGYYVGGIVGYSEANVTIKKSINSGNIISNYSSGCYVAGIVGYTEKSANIVDCKNTGNVTGVGYYIGGIVGRVSETVSIKNCGNEGMITSTTECNGYSYTGGIVGYLSNSSYLLAMSGCYNTGNISAADIYVGGLAGYIYSGNSESNITNCYTTGNVTSTKSKQYAYIGGAFGRVNCPVVSSVYSDAIITKNATATGCVGAFAGSLTSTLTNCYYDSDKTKLSFNGYEDTTPDASVNGGKSTAAFQSGEVAYLLNGSRSVSTDESPLVWYQTLDKDNAPKFKGMVVYYDAEKDPAYYNIATKPGDLNGDNKYNIADLSLLIQALKDGKSASALPAADVNGDGTVNLNDITTLRKLILEVIGKDRETLHNNGNEPTPDDNGNINADAKKTTFDTGE